jgi:hypothetical protein
MNPRITQLVQRSRPYFKALVLALPALVFWQAAYIFLFPKLEIIWQHGNGPSSDAQGVMDAVILLVRYGTPVFLSALTLLLVLDICARSWARYRNVAVTSLAFIFNAAVLFGLSAMCVAALIIAPELMRMK